MRVKRVTHFIFASLLISTLVICVRHLSGVLVVHRKAETGNGTQTKNTEIRMYNNNIAIETKLSESPNVTHEEFGRFEMTNSIINLYDNNQPVQDESQCVSLANLHPLVHICIHDPEDDIWISKEISLHQFWEEQNVNFFMNLLHHYPLLNVIDVGANIGQYTLIGAHLGRKVVAVEARLKHVQMIHHAVVLNKFQHLVTIVHNAVSDKRTLVNLGFYHNNQGGTYVIEREQNINEEPSNQHQDDNSKSILMNDLAAKVNFSQAVLKMDIETYEGRALSHADVLFDKVNIPYIIMEWAGMKRKPEAEVAPLLAWFKNRGYQAFVIAGKEFAILEYSKWTSWPGDVYLKHHDVAFNLYE